MGILDLLGNAADWTNNNLLGGLFTTDPGAGGKPVPPSTIPIMASNSYKAPPYTGMFGLGPQTWGEKLGTLAVLGLNAAAAAYDASRTAPPRAEGNPVQPIGASAYHQTIAGLTPQQIAIPQRLPTITLPGSVRAIVNPYL